MLDIAAKAIRPGITTDEIDRIVHEVRYYKHRYNDIQLLIKKRILSLKDYI